MYDFDKNICVWGHDADSTAVKTYLRSGYQDPDRARQAEVIAWKESRYRQFRDNGEPNWSGDGLGVGIMQITNPPPDPTDYFNWKANVDKGKSMIQQKWNRSEYIFGIWVDRGWPEPTTEMYYYDTYCRYNGGNYYTAQKDPDPPEGSGEMCWVRNTDWANECNAGECTGRGREVDFNWIAGECQQSGPCYADDAMARH